jgi:hypothetical protein
VHLSESTDGENATARTVQRNGSTYPLAIGGLRQRRVEPITKLIEEAAEFAAGRQSGICPSCGQPVSHGDLIVSLDTNQVSIETKT